MPRKFYGTYSGAAIYQNDIMEIVEEPDGWCFDGDCPDPYVVISALSDKTIKKLVIHRADWNNTVIVNANGNSNPYTKSGELFTYDGIDASEVRISANPDYDDDWLCTVAVDEHVITVSGIFTGEDDNNYDVTVTYVVPDLFDGHSLTLNGSIGVNFYLNPTPEDADVTTVTLTWNGKTLENVPVVLDPNDTGLYKATCPVAAAEMTCPITATVTINEEVQDETDTYSVREYADVILSADYESSYTGTGYQSCENLTNLVKTMLDYGAKAQMKFGVNTDSLANAGIGYTAETVKAASIPSDKDAPQKLSLTQYGLRYYAASVLFVETNTLRHYFRVTSASKFSAVRDSVTFDAEGAEKPKAAVYGEKSGLVYFDMKNIMPADLDTPYVLTIGSTTFKYTVCDYIKTILTSGTSSAEDKEPAQSFYLYGQAAKTFFTYKSLMKSRLCNSLFM